MANGIALHLLRKMKSNLRFSLILCITFVEVFLNFGRRFYSDSDQYVSYSLFFLGRSPYFDISGVAMRPMVPIIASPLILIFGDANLSFGLVSSFFWVSGVIVAYKLGQILLKDKDLASLVAISYTFAPTLLIYGAGVLVDSAGFFFIGLAVYLTLKREQQIVSSKTYFMDAMIVSFGVLFKETVLFALVFMLVRRLLKNKGFFASLVAAVLVGVFELSFLRLLGFDVSVFVSSYLMGKQIALVRGQHWGFLPFLISLSGAYATTIGAPQPYFISVGFWMWTILPLIFGLSTLVGFIHSSRRRDLITCVLFLFPISVILPTMFTRYSFCMWPAVIPAMISGMDIVLIRLFQKRETNLSYSKLTIYLYIIMVGVIDTVAVLTCFNSLTITLR